MATKKHALLSTSMAVCLLTAAHSTDYATSVPHSRPWFQLLLTDQTSCPRMNNCSKIDHAHMGLAPGSKPSILACSQRVRHTLATYYIHAKSLQQLYVLKRKVFSLYCKPLDINPLACTMNNVWEFLQSQLEGSLSGSGSKDRLAHWVKEMIVQADLNSGFLWWPPGQHCKNHHLQRIVK